jgi:hypothetical protein
VAQAVAPQPAHRHHFRIAYGVLALAFWLSVAAFVVLLERPHHSKAVAWSQWKPSTQGLAGAHEIALQVASKYRGPNGAQLVAVQEHGPEVQGQPLEAIGVRRLDQSGQINPYIGLFHASGTLIYAFCGLQTQCALQGDNTASQRRTLRREALELSLYSLRYLHGVDQVVSLVQSVRDGGMDAVFLRKADLEPELRHPIRDTLPLAVPPQSDAPDPREEAVIDALTLPNTFPAHFESLPDGDAILVLDVENQATTN